MFSKRNALPVLLASAMAHGGGLVFPRSNTIEVSGRTRKKEKRATKSRYYSPNCDVVKNVQPPKLSKKQKAKRKAAKKKGK